MTTETERGFAAGVGFLGLVDSFRHHDMWGGIASVLLIAFALAVTAARKPEP